LPDFTIADFFAVCSSQEFVWFIEEVFVYFRQRLAEEKDVEVTMQYDPTFYPGDICIDRGRRYIHWPSKLSSVIPEVSQFVAGLVMLSVDDGTTGTATPRAKAGRLRAKLVARASIDMLQLQIRDGESQRLNAALELVPSTLARGNYHGFYFDGGRELCRNGERTGLVLEDVGDINIDLEDWDGGPENPHGMVLTRNPRTLYKAVPGQVTSTVVIPSAGRSSRFPGHKPKWLLTMPNGRLMVVDAIAQLNLKQVHRIVLGVLKEHVDKYCNGDVSTLVKAFEDGPAALADIELSIVVIESETVDQVQTIEAILAAAKVTGPIFLKDCDNQFACDIPGIDGVATLEITKDMQSLNVPAGKSYVELDSAGGIQNIVEKVILGPTFCVGGYSFADAKRFVKFVNVVRKLQKLTNASSIELAVSDVIWWITIMGEQGSGEKFVSIPVRDYEDWGTVQAWEAYCGTFRTLFLDIDGTLIKNSGAYFKPNWGMQPKLDRSVAHIKTLHERGRTQIILTTSRPESFREVTEKQLKEAGVPYDHIVFGMFHAQRVLVNDYAKTNPFPSASAINLKRDGDELPEMLGTY
jgi:hypothetical protein